MTNALTTSLTSELNEELASEADTLALARTFVPFLLDGAVLYLKGELGAGKTTFTRGLMRGLGHEGAVKSPTFTLVEPYETQNPCVYHFDLYRVNDPDELEYIGLLDYFDGSNLCVVEWPERGEGLLPPSDITICLDVDGVGRRVRMLAKSERGERIMARFQQSREKVA